MLVSLEIACCGEPEETEMFLKRRSRIRIGRELIDPALFERLCRRIVLDHGRDERTAARIMDQALAFLAACASAPRPLAPSAEVDLGWHAFLLYTREYADFCERVAGRFIHHRPDDDPTASVDADPPAATAAIIGRLGFQVDLALWAAPSGPGRDG
jgi:hypothetical protein